MYYVYILYSFPHARTYVGQTQNLAQRLRIHNSAKERSTKAYRPWSVIYTEEYKTRGEALNREAWFKGPAGRKRIAQILADCTARGTGLSVTPMA